MTWFVLGAIVYLLIGAIATTALFNQQRRPLSANEFTGGVLAWPFWITTAAWFYLVGLIQGLKK